MSSYIRNSLRIAGLLIVIVFLVGCLQLKPRQTLRIAVLPILDTLPMYVAEAEGFFKDNGIKVELIPVASAAERDQLLQAEQVDVVITDLVALALYNREQTKVIAVRYAMVPTDQFAQFRIVASAVSKITSPSQLIGEKIGISQGTIIEYITTRLLEREGFNLEQFELVSVPKLSDRTALLYTGGIQAATLPEPMASQSMQTGATLILDDTQLQDISCSIYAFRKDFVQDNSTTVTNFLLSISQASTAINADKNQWETLLVDNKIVPSSFVKHFTLPDYPDNTLPTASQFNDVVNWLMETQRLDIAPKYADVVDASLLPE